MSPYVVGFFTELVALIVLFPIVATVEMPGRNRYGEGLIDVFGFAITSTPGVGTVYKSVRRMGDVMLDGGDENARDSKLVQCFEEDVYVSGFVTSESREIIETSTGHDDVVSMFLPMAPNPVTGGLLTYVPESDVYDIDMTVEGGPGHSHRRRRHGAWCRGLDTAHDGRPQARHRPRLARIDPGRRGVIAR